MMIHDARSIYMIGIKGVGMTALAEVLAGWHKHVSGSDVSEIFPTDMTLRAHAIPVAEMFREQNIPAGTDLVIYSTAYREDHVERAAARAKGIPSLSYPEALAELMRGKYGIAVAGSHGKTTTTALLGHVMHEAGLDPTVIVGSRALNFVGNARVGKSEYVLIEADEYQNKLALYRPRGAIITNVDWDHPDYFRTEEEYRVAFDTFRSAVLAEGGWIVENMHNIKIKNENTLPLSLSGAHNRENVALVYRAATTHLGVSRDVFWKAVASFRGTVRRFEVKGKTKSGALVMDDYAHHPTEVRATITALRERFPNERLSIVFQPHTFTRTRQFLDDFATALASADRIFLLDIYASAREQAGGVHTRDLLTILQRHQPGRAADFFYTPTRDDAWKSLGALDSHDVVVTMGAGDVWMLSETLTALDIP